MEPANQSEELLTEAQLKSWTRFSQTAALLDFLKDNGITYFRGKGGTVITTVKAVNDALANDKESNVDW